LPSYAVDNEVVVEIGDLWSGEQRSLLLGFAVPALSELGLAQVAEMEFRYVLVPDLVEQTVTLPVAVNVVPGDQAAGRIPNPVVTSELVFLQTQDAKRRAAEQLRDGDIAGASNTYRQASRMVAQRLNLEPSAELAEEAEILGTLDARLEAGDAAWSARTSRAEQARKSRTRGR
jgi:Ca-activated chloride channel family protein